MIKNTEYCQYRGPRDKNQQFPICLNYPLSVITGSSDGDKKYGCVKKWPDFSWPENEPHPWKPLKNRVVFLRTRIFYLRHSIRRLRIIQANGEFLIFISWASILAVFCIFVHGFPRKWRLVEYRNNILEWTSPFSVLDEPCFGADFAR